MAFGGIYDWLRTHTSYRVRVWFKNRSWFVPLARVLFGNNVYSRSYYTDVERIESESMPPIADTICQLLSPRRAIDVGCGPGHLMRALHERGVQVVGVDVSDDALRMVAEKGLQASKVDLTSPETELPGAPYDLAISCEVAEHIEGRFATTFLKKLTAAAPVVFLTAAEPDSGAGVGLYHVNEQPNSYWIDLMSTLGYQYRADTTDAIREKLLTISCGYLRCPMIFARDGFQIAASNA